LKAATRSASKGMKRRVRPKGGRPRKEGVDRFDCGKIKPYETEREVKSVAIEARMRIHLGINDNSEAKKQDLAYASSVFAGYTLGRIFLDGNITEGQRKAGDAFGEAMARYYSLTGIPFPSARAQSLFSIAGHDGEVSEDRAKRARNSTNKMMELTGALLQCIDGPQVRQTILNVVVMDHEVLRKMPPQQMRWLKRGLDKLQSHMGIAD